MSTSTLSAVRGLAATLAAAAIVASFAGCASHKAVTTNIMTQAEQQAMSPDDAVARLAEGNRRFMTGQADPRDLPAQVQGSATAQFPFAVVLSCIDSRSSPELVFDQGLGDIFAPRIAGNYVQADLLGSMEFATKVAGARLIVVMGHNACGAVMGACDDVQMGNLTTVIQAIRPAVNAVQTPTTNRTSANAEFVQKVAVENVRLTVEKIRTDSPILRDLERSGKIKIVGAMQDLNTGAVQFLQM
jgi:carbonic anhydrase